MISSARQAVACMLVTFGCVFGSHAQTASSKGPGATISGRVTIKDKGARGVVVGLRLAEGDREPSRYRAVTDDEGNYKISNVPPGQYVVTTATPVFVRPDPFNRGKTLLIGKDETIENVDIALVRGGVITGKVTDGDGRPVVEEDVSLYPLHMTPRSVMPLGGHTDDRGIYRIFGVPPGDYKVAAGTRDEAGISFAMRRANYKLTFHPAAADISQGSIIEVGEGSEATDVDITLARPLMKYSASGRIVDGVTGKPMPNVRYGVSYVIDENSGGSTTSGAVTDSQGEFKLENLTPGKYGVFVDPLPGTEWRADAVPFTIVDQDINGLILKTSKGASVSGVVVLEGTDDKTLLASFRKVRIHANIFEDESHGSSALSSPIDEAGNFRIGTLKAGTVAFSLSNYGRFQIVRVERNGVAYPKGLEIKEGEQMSGVRVVLNYGSGTLRGVLNIEGGKLPDNGSAFASLRRVGEDIYLLNSWSSAVRVDARGNFFADGLVPGTYELNTGVFVPGSPGPLRHIKQQVVIADGGVTNVTVTVNLKSTSDRP
jgi:protocatechuate 3,4-dioxygenase beta subunit